MSTSRPHSTSPPPLSSPIEVPEVLELTRASGTEFDVVQYVHFLLTSLLREGTGLLHAQFQNGTGIWLLRQRPSGVEGPDVEIARLDGVGIFRAVLARFGYFYMGVQLYGGFARRALIHHGRQYACTIYLSNDNSTGYWIRVYAHTLAEQSGST